MWLCGSTKLSMPLWKKLFKKNQYLVWLPLIFSLLFIHWIALIFTFAEAVTEMLNRGQIPFHVHLIMILPNSVNDFGFIWEQYVVLKLNFLSLFSCANFKCGCLCLEFSNCFLYKSYESLFCSENVWLL